MGPIRECGWPRMWWTGHGTAACSSLCNRDNSSLTLWEHPTEAATTPRILWQRAQRGLFITSLITVCFFSYGFGRLQSFCPLHQPCQRPPDRSSNGRCRSLDLRLPSMADVSLGWQSFLLQKLRCCCWAALSHEGATEGSEQAMKHSWERER